MRHTIKSRKLKREITFSLPGCEYIYVDLNGKAGYLGDQICKGGYLMGSTIWMRGDDDDPEFQKRFENICKSWWKQYIARFHTEELI